MRVPQLRKPCACRISGDFLTPYQKPQMTEPQNTNGKRLSPIPAFIFMSRWLQLPLYLGLILAQCVYVFHFWVELKDLIGAVFGDAHSLEHIISVTFHGSATAPTKLTETVIMLV